jgi:hypothetical protein
MNKGWIISDLGTFNFLYKDSLQMNKLNNGMSWSDFTFFSDKEIFSFYNLKIKHKFVIFVFSKDFFLFDDKFLLKRIDVELENGQIDKLKYEYIISFQEPNIFDLDSIPNKIKNSCKENDFFKKMLIKKRLGNENN